jgi:hypothetical protein
VANAAIRSTAARWRTRWPTSPTTVRDEVLWDQRALQAADLLTDERVAVAGVTSPVAGFYPSLQLNLGECYRKLGDDEQARQHLEAGLAAVDALPEDGYGRMISGGLQRLSRRLHAG